MAENLPHIEDKAIVDAGARIVAQRFARVDPMKALEWVDTLPVEAQTRAIELAVAAFMADHPDLAKEEIMGMDTGREREVSVSRMLRTLAAEDVTQAVDWFETLGPADQNPDAWITVSGLWFDKDPQAAGEWVYAASPGSGRDTAASNFAGKLADQSNFDAALQWSAVITDPATREGSLTATFERWLANDRPAAAKALSETALPASVKSGLLNP